VLSSPKIVGTGAARISGMCVCLYWQRTNVSFVMREQTQATASGRYCRASSASSASDDFDLSHSWNTIANRMGVYCGSRDWLVARLHSASSHY